jgi:1-acyl-sn-glycerol-3-phosphate acyltransferase
VTTDGAQDAGLYWMMHLSRDLFYCSRRKSIRHLFYETLKFFVVRLLRLFFSFRVENVHHVPPAGSFILAANHVSFLDSVVLQAACPRRITFMMAEKYYNPIWGRWFFRLMTCIPLRDETSYNIGPLKKGLKILQDGGVIGIFPEGGISPHGEITDAQPGTLLLAEKSSAPVVPAFISGTYQALPRHARFFRRATIRVLFGSQVGYPELSKGLKGKRGLQEASRNLMHAIKALI